MSVLHRIGGTENPARRADVVFVHGLGGDAFDTWRHGNDETTSWPHWLSAEHPEVGVWSLQYAAAATRWTRLLSLFGGRDDAGQAMDLADRAGQVLDLMGLHGLGTRPLVFIGHSLGGLLIKRLLRKSRDTDRPRDAAIFAATRGVLFLATPHAGATLASLASVFRALVQPSANVDDLRAHDAELRDLLNWYRRHAAGIATATYFETRDLGGLRIVNETSSHPAVGADPVALDDDHVSIAKPRDRDAQVCRAARELVALALTSAAPVDAVVAADDGGTPAVAARTLEDDWDFSPGVALIGVMPAGPVYASDAFDATCPLVTSFDAFAAIYGGDDLDLVTNGQRRACVSALAARAFFDSGGRALRVARVFASRAADGGDGRASCGVAALPGLSILARWPGSDGDATVVVSLHRVPALVYRPTGVDVFHVRSAADGEVIDAGEPGRRLLVRLVDGRQRFEDADGVAVALGADTPVWRLRMRIEWVARSGRRHVADGLSTVPAAPDDFRLHLDGRAPGTMALTDPQRDGVCPVVLGGETSPRHDAIRVINALEGRHELGGGHDGPHPEWADFAPVVESDAWTRVTPELEFVMMPDAAGHPDVARAVDTAVRVASAQRPAMGSATLLLDAPPTASAEVLVNLADRMPGRRAVVLTPWLQIEGATAEAAPRPDVPPSGVIAAAGTWSPLATRIAGPGSAGNSHRRLRAAPHPPELDYLDAAGAVVVRVIDGKVALSGEGHVTEGLRLDSVDRLAEHIGRCVWRGLFASDILFDADANARARRASNLVAPWLERLALRGVFRPSMAPSVSAESVDGALFVTCELPFVEGIRQYTIRLEPFV